MAIDYEKFNKKVDLAELQKEIAKAEKENKQYEDIPDGDYIVDIEKMEITETKSGDKLMFSAQCKIKSGSYKGRRIFFNRVICGNRSTERWNDGKAISSVCTWVNKLIDDNDDPVEFVNYPDFTDQILDVFQYIQEQFEVDVTYAAKSFNPITINHIYEL